MKSMCACQTSWRRSIIALSTPHTSSISHTNEPSSSEETSAVLLLPLLLLLLLSAGCERTSLAKVAHLQFSTA